jgi:hypothetical protein
MTKQLLMITILALQSIAAQALTLNDVVIAEDNSDGEAATQFPCRKYMSAIFCDNRLILESKCSETLQIKDNTIACRIATGELVQFAKIQSESRFADDTAPGIFGYKVSFTSRASLLELKTPNGNIEHQLIVK